MEAAEARVFLRKVKILADLSDQDLDELATSLTWRWVRAGEQVVSHLDVGDEVFLAAEGTFRARLETAIGRQVAIRQLPAGSHFGEIAALMRTPRSLGIIADTDGNVLIADTENHQIRRYVPGKEIMELVAGKGTKGKGGVDGDPKQVEMARPHGVSVHPKTGEMYIADSDNNRVLKIVK